MVCLLIKQVSGSIESLVSLLYTACVEMAYWDPPIHVYCVDKLLNVED